MIFKNSIKCITDCLTTHPFKLQEENKEVGEHQNLEKVVVLFPFGGRIDQTLSSMHTLCNSSEFLKSKDTEDKDHNIDMVLMDNCSIMQ